MVNSEDFTKRLQIIMNYYDLSAAAFADAIEVGRSSISHLLSGRNKPSLDFVLKIVHSFPDVELYWLLNGKGNFPAPSEASGAKSQFPVVDTQMDSNPVSLESSPEIHHKDSANTSLPITGTEKQISQIVIFYSDGSFDAYKN